jgi:hypothetical protein
MKLLELFEQSGKTVAVAFGRLNPPTIGHGKLIEALLKQPADAHFLFVSHTHKSTGKNKTRYENPLPFDIKLGFIQQAFSNVNIGDTSVKTVIEMMKHLENQGYQNVTLVCGSDRVADFTQLLNAQNGIDYNIESIKIKSSGFRDPDGEGVEGMSGSKMRQAAIDNDFEKFKSGLAVGLQNNAQAVFSAVRQGLDPWIEKDSTNDQVKESPIEMDPSEPMNPMIYGAGGNPAKLQYRMMRAANQLKDLAARAQGASAGEWDLISKHFEELTMNINQIRHGLDELKKVRAKGGIKSRGIEKI